MTNWMTAAGLALIAGGLATLITFRSFLFGGGEKASAERSGARSGGRSGMDSNGRPDARSGERSGSRPGVETGVRPGERSRAEWSGRSGRPYGAGSNGRSLERSGAGSNRRAEARLGRRGEAIEAPRRRQTLHTPAERTGLSGRVAAAAPYGSATEDVDFGPGSTPVEAIGAEPAFAEIEDGAPYLVFDEHTAGSEAVAPEPVLAFAEAEPFVDGSGGEVEEQLAVEDGPARSRRGRRGRRRALVAASGGRGTAYVRPGSSDQDDRGGLASIGFAAYHDDGEFDVSEPEHEPIAEARHGEPVEPPAARRRRGRRSRPEPNDEILFDPPARHEAEPRFTEADRFAPFTSSARRPFDDQDHPYGSRQAFVSPALSSIDDLPMHSAEGRSAHYGDLGAEMDDSVEQLRPARSDRYGDRIEGWVRPEYQEQPDEPRPGEYWTPIPVDLDPDPEPSAQGYGWPLLVERLPAVPDYEPATGFDLTPVPAEPTEPVQIWPATNDRLSRSTPPRTWPSQNEKRRRPRPRPRPEISSLDSDDPPPSQPPSTMYVSRHAADPPPR